MSDPIREGELSVKLTKAFRCGHDTSAIAVWLNDHYGGDAPVIIELLLGLLRSRSSVMAEQLRAWAELLTASHLAAPVESIVAGLVEVANDIDPDPLP